MVQKIFVIILLTCTTIITVTDSLTHEHDWVNLAAVIAEKNPDKLREALRQGIRSDFPIIFGKHKGMTHLILAIKTEVPLIVALLLHYGADPQRRIGNKTPLDIVIELKNKMNRKTFLTIGRLLLRYGASHPQAGTLFLTGFPLSQAALKEGGITKILLKHESSLHTKEVYKERLNDALCYAVAQGTINNVKMLRDAGAQPVAQPGRPVNNESTLTILETIIRRRFQNYSAQQQKIYLAIAGILLEPLVGTVDEEKKELNEYEVALKNVAQIAVLYYTPNPSRNVPLEKIKAQLPTEFTEYFKQQIIRGYKDRLERWKKRKHPLI